MKGKSTPRIATTGVGPAGLCLARILQHNTQTTDDDCSWDVTIYEADASKSSHRSQGGSLDLHVDAGQRALKQAGPTVFKAFCQLTQKGDDALSIRTSHDNELVCQDGGDGSRPEIERKDLRDLLLSSLKPNTVQWNKKLVRAQEEEECNTGASKMGKCIRLTFQDGDVQWCDLIAGADGAWSKVRSSLTDAMPEHAGVSFWEQEALNGASNSVKCGMIFAVDDKGGVSVSHLNSTKVHSHVGSFCEKGALRPMSDLVKGWNTDLLELAGINNVGDDADKNTTNSPTLREIHMPPIAIRWSRPRITDRCHQQHWTHHVALIGDAAHLMSPMAGEGVNLALADAADLAAVLLSDCTSSSTDFPPTLALAEFEQRHMF